MSTAMVTQTASSNSMTVQLDPAQISMLRGLRNGALLPQLLRTYRDQSGALVTAIGTATANGDASALLFAAHTLKSASFSIGARRMGELCTSLEAAGRADDLSATALLCTELEKRFAALTTEIEQYL